MKTYRHIFGFGGCKILAGGHEALFNYARCEIRYQPERDTQITLNRDTFDRNFGWRVVITMDAVNSTCDNWKTHGKLIDALNAYFTYGHTLTVYPQWTDNEGAEGFICRLVSDYDPKSLSGAKVAQSLKLQFETIGLVQSISDFMSDMVQEGYAWSNNGSDIAGGIVTGDGDRIVFLTNGE